MHCLEIIACGGSVPAGSEDDGSNAAFFQFGPDVRQRLLFPQHKLGGMPAAQGIKGRPLGRGDRFIGFPMDALQVPAVLACQVTIDRVRCQERSPLERLGKLP